MSLQATKESTKSMADLYPLVLLCTGTCMAVIAQVIANMGATAPAAQLIPLTKYACGCVINGCVFPLSEKQKTPKQGGFVRSQKAELTALAVGLLEVLAYGLNCLAFPLVGSALSMVIFAATGQPFTAVARLLLLKKHMSSRQTVAVVIITVGVIVRSGLTRPGNFSQSFNFTDNQTARGVALTTASAAFYSFMGVMYERLITMPGTPLSHEQITLRMSLTGVMLMTLYQIMFTLPNRQALILEPFSASGTHVGQVVGMYFLFGVCFSGHAMIQGRVLETKGAMAMGVVNSVRSMTVTLASAVLFCNPYAPQQCLDRQKLIAVMVISIGALLWATAPPAVEKHEPVGKEE